MSLFRSAGIISMGLLLVASAGAEIKSEFSRNRGPRENRAFTFAQAASPLSDDAATNARCFLVGGRADPNSAPLAVIQDGKLPVSGDQPGANFFFAPGTDGGRIVIDLGQPTRVAQVSTYSWHRDTRGPQVYRLYGSDGAGKDFILQLGAERDPAQAGWTFLSAIDTRPPAGTDGARPTYEFGGQYAARTWDPAGPLGTFRYILLDVRRTGGHEQFDQTFFSEIDVCDGKQHKPAVAIDFDTSETPELAEWVDKTLRPTCLEWYPKIVAMLPSQGFTAPTRLSVTFKKDMQGVAHTAGTRIVCAEPWFKRNLRGEAAGAVVHELVHVAQQYRRMRGGRANPSWLVEGVADYIRWFLYEPPEHRPRVNPRRSHYRDGYRTTGAFLDYLIRSGRKDLILNINATMREGRYDESLWKTWAGKPLDELWDEFVATPRSQ